MKIIIVVFAALLLSGCYEEVSEIPEQTKVVQQDRMKDWGSMGDASPSDSLWVR